MCTLKKRDKKTERAPRQLREDELEGVSGGVLLREMFEYTNPGKVREGTVAKGSGISMPFDV